MALRELQEVVGIVVVLSLGTAVPAEAPIRRSVASDQWIIATGHPDAVWLATMADSAGVPRLIMWAVAYEESRYNLDPGVRSVKGALGRMQVMAPTAIAYCAGLDISGYEDNVRCGARILRAHRDELGSWDEAVRRYQGRGPIARQYRERVFAMTGRFAIRLEELAP